MSITDVRSSLFLRSPAFTLDTNGFTVIKHSSTLSSPPYSPIAGTMLAIHYPEIEKPVKEQTGASMVLTIMGLPDRGYI
jgi:hypothetical protein